MGADFHFQFFFFFFVVVGVFSASWLKHTGKQITHRSTISQPVSCCGAYPLIAVGVGLARLGPPSARTTPGAGRAAGVGTTLRGYAFFSPVVRTACGPSGRQEEQTHTSARRMLCGWVVAWDAVCVAISELISTQVGEKQWSVVLFEPFCAALENSAGG